MELIGLGLVIGAGGLWASATLHSRPKFKDEQTLIGGTIWSQIIIPIGLLISLIVEEPFDDIVLGYFLISGIILMSVTASSVMSNECKKLKRAKYRAGSQAQSSSSSPKPEADAKAVTVPAKVTPIILELELTQSYDRIYFGIALLILVAAIVKFVELSVVVGFKIKYAYSL